MFEVIRVYDGQAVRVRGAHARLERSAANLRLPVDLEAVRADAYRLLAQAGAGPDHQALRIVITRGGRRLLLTEPSRRRRRSRLASVTYAPTRVLDGVKSLSYGGQHAVLAARAGAGVRRGAAGDPHGRVLEAPTSSLFWVSASASS